MRTPRVLLGAVSAAALISGCDQNNHGNPVPVAPVISASAAATAAPTAAATSTALPTAIATSSGASIQQFCQLTNTSLNSNYPPVPGTYTLLETEGVLTGTNYVQNDGAYEPVIIASPAPATSPTPVPTVTPVYTPTPFSTSTPTYVYDVYTGGYKVPAYTQTPPASASPGATPLAVSATTGCFLFVSVVNQPTPDPGTTPYNAIAIGLPFDPFGENDDDSGGAVGQISAFSLSTLSASGGSGSFTLDNGVTGQFSVGQEQTYSESAVKRIKAFYRNRFRKGN